MRTFNVYFMISLVISTSTSCPIQECSCYDVPDKQGRVIDCREKSLRRVPKITPSDEIFSEITFQNDDDATSQLCDECNRIRSIGADDFRGLKVRKIDLWNNGVESIDVDAFRDLEQTLMHLALSGTGSFKPPFLSLRKLTNLRRLELGHFNMDRIDQYNTFQDFPNMEALKLIDMKLRYIDSNAFRDKLQQLEYLEITGNQKLVIFPVMAFRRLPSIVELIYKDNGLTRLPRYSFLRLKQLKSLDMSYNKIRELRPGCFRTITRSLEYINLDHNRLNENKIRPLMYHPWEKLQHVRMSWNQLTVIPPNMFITMKKSLKTLSVVSNKLTKISMTDFILPKLLESLDISENPLEGIEEEAFASLSNLNKLKLEGLNDGTSKILSIRNVFDGLSSSLTDLSMRRTRVISGELWKEISNLVNIRRLDLSLMKLDWLPNYAFKSNIFLHFLDLSGNNLKGEISELQLDGLQTSLQTLKLTYNEIQSLDRCIFKDFKKLKNVMLFKNPIACDCRSEGLQEWIKQKSLVNPLVPYIVQSECQQPAAVAGRDLYKIPTIQSGSGEACLFDSICLYK